MILKTPTNYLPSDILFRRANSIDDYNELTIDGPNVTELIRIKIIENE